MNFGRFLRCWVLVAMVNDVLNMTVPGLQSLQPRTIGVGALLLIAADRRTRPLGALDSADAREICVRVYAALLAVTAMPTLLLHCLHPRLAAAEDGMRHGAATLLIFGLLTMLRVRWLVHRRKADLASRGPLDGQDPAPQVRAGSPAAPRPPIPARSVHGH